MKTNLQPISLSGRRKRKLQQQVEKYLADLQKDRNNYKLHIELGDVYALLEEPQRSIKSYYSAIDLLRQTPNLEKSRDLMIELYGKIINLAPDEKRAYSELSEEYVATGQKEKAFRFLLSSAKKAYEAENYEFALQCYNQVMAKGKTNPHIVERCTELYLKLGRKEDAMKNYIQIGDIYAQEEKYVEALEYYKKANALNNEDPELILRIARMYNAMEWAENAVVELVKLGEYYEKCNNYNEALKYYRNGARLDPENEKAQQGKERLMKFFAIGVLEENFLDIQEDQNQDVLQELDKIEGARETDSIQAEQPASQESSLSTVGSSSAVPISLKDNIIDLKNGGLENLTIEEGLEEQKTDYMESESEQSQDLDLKADQNKNTGQESSLPAEAGEGAAKTDIQFIPEEHFIEFSEGTSDNEEQPDQVQSEDNLTKMQQTIQDLEQQIQRTEEEKYFLQEQFTAQIHRLKVQEESFQKEITVLYKDKEELERRLEQITVTYQTSRQDSEKFDEARYEALVTKIQGRKVLLQQQLSKLLRKREENGRFLTEELNTLGTTKQRLQNNLEYIQQLKARIEEKIQTELHHTNQELELLRETSQTLEVKLSEQQQTQQALRKQFEALSKEKELLQENSTETIDALTGRNAELEKQLQQLSKAKEALAKGLKKKVYSLQQTYQQRQTEYKAALQEKEAQLTESAQKLGEFADKYVKIEKTLADIRKERDDLGTMLAQETATREMLEEKLVGIESQVETLEIQGTELLNQIGQELDRHFNMEQSASDEFQDSLEELERLLLLQEEEIRSLEAL
jgi:hypothetical protein